MKKTMTLLLATALLATAVSAMAMPNSVAGHDELCAKSCESLVTSCSGGGRIQENIQKLEFAIEHNADRYTPEQLATLKAKLDEARQRLADLQKG